MPGGHDTTIEVSNIMSFVLYSQILKKSVLKPVSPGITLTRNSSKMSKSLLHSLLNKTMTSKINTPFYNWIELTTWTIYAFWVLNPSQWSSAEQSILKYTVNCDTKKLKPKESWSLNAKYEKFEYLKRLQINWSWSKSLAACILFLFVFSQAYGQPTSTFTKFGLVYWLFYVSVNEISKPDWINDIDPMHILGVNPRTVILKQIAIQKRLLFRWIHYMYFKFGFNKHYRRYAHFG